MIVGCFSHSHQHFGLNRWQVDVDVVQVHRQTSAEQQRSEDQASGKESLANTFVSEFRIERENSPLKLESIFISMLAAALEALQLILDETSKTNKNSSVRKPYFRYDKDFGDQKGDGGRGGFPAVCVLAVDELLMCDYCAEPRGP